MIVSTTMDLDGYDVVEYRGMVRGIVVRSPTITQGLMGGLKNIIGGNIESFRTMCEQARSQAYDLMIEHAQELGATAVLGVRYESAQIGGDRSSATEVLCYGTAVITKKSSV